MQWTLTRLIIVFSLLLFSGLFWWLPEALVEPAINLAGLKKNQPDYWIQRFHMVSMNDVGTPKFDLRAESLVHFPGTVATRIDKPYLVQYDQGAAPLATTADTGWVSPDGKKLLMTGNVKIARGHDPEFAEAEVMSNQVTVTLD